MPGISLYSLAQHILAGIASYNYKFIYTPGWYEQHVLVVGSGARRNVSTPTYTATGKAVHSNGRTDLGHAQAPCPLNCALSDAAIAAMAFT